jgi:hypothetical protein
MAEIDQKLHGNGQMNSIVDAWQHDNGSVWGKIVILVAVDIPTSIKTLPENILP